MNRRSFLSILGIVMLSAVLVAGCGRKDKAEDETAAFTTQSAYAETEKSAAATEASTEETRIEEESSADGSPEAAEGDMKVFESIPRGTVFGFFSGVGAWETMLSVLPDGSFSGQFYDMNMGECGEGYDNGTLYECSFGGKFSAPFVVDSYASSSEGQPPYSGVVEITRDENGIRGQGVYGYRFNQVETDQDGKVIYWGIDLFDENGKDMYRQIETVFCDESTYIPEPEDMLSEEDVNFDGRPDIVIQQGCFGAQGVSYYKAYIRTDDGFEEVIGYDEIPNANVSPQESGIYGSIRDGASRYYQLCYEVQGNKAVKISEIPFEYDESAGGYVEVK